MPTPNRYFNIPYFYRTAKEDGFSSINIQTTGFPSEEFIMMVAAAKVQKMYNLPKEEKVLIAVQGWSEFRNHKDYLSFIKRN